MKLIRYEKPNYSSSSLGDWFQNSDRLFGLRQWPSMFDWDLDGSNRTYRLSADLYEDDEAYFARFELPGVKKKDVKIDLHNAVLTVSYERHSKSDNGAESSECFSRSISVPDGIDADKISAQCEDGLLTVSMPKAETKKPRFIKIK